MRMYVGTRDNGVWSVTIRVPHCEPEPLRNPTAADADDPGYRWGYDGPAVVHLAGCILLDHHGWTDGAPREQFDPVHFAAAREMLKDELAKASTDWFQVSAKDLKRLWKDAAKRIPALLEQRKKVLEAQLNQAIAQAGVPEVKAHVRESAMPTKLPMRLSPFEPHPCHDCGQPLNGWTDVRMSIGGEPTETTVDEKGFMRVKNFDIGDVTWSCAHCDAALASQFFSGRKVTTTGVDAAVVATLA